jgi:hypothetical protein
VRVRVTTCACCRGHTPTTRPAPHPLLALPPQSLAIPLHVHTTVALSLPIRAYVPRFTLIPLRTIRIIRTSRAIRAIDRTLSRTHVPHPPSVRPVGVRGEDFKRGWLIVCVCGARFPLSMGTGKLSE